MNAGLCLEYFEDLKRDWERVDSNHLVQDMKNVRSYMNMLWDSVDKM